MKKREAWIDKLLIFLHPPLKIGRSDWLGLWRQKDFFLYKKTSTRVWTTFCVVYVGHFFAVDLPLKRTPIELWASFRFGLGFCAAITLYLVNSKKQPFGKYYRLPSLVSALVYSYFQAQSMIWRAETPYTYSIIIAVCAITSLNASMALSIGYLIFEYLIQLNAWLSRPGELPHIISAAAFGCIVTAVLRARMATDVDLFIAEQQQLEGQRDLIQKQTELNQQIRAFLPRKIYQQFLGLVDQQKLSVVQAMEEVLRPRSTFASCIYSDIRGFTKLVKKGNQYVLDSILPSQRTFTDIVQDYDGIPRITGDLVFAIFENGLSVTKTLDEAFRCALDVVQKQKELNSTTSHHGEIKRYVLLSFGPAILGNTGGIDGSREIAAIGSCANILSRVDELTKSPGIRELVSSNSIILTDEAANILLLLYPKLPHRSVKLSDFGLKMRDFPKQERIVIFDHSTIDQRFLIPTHDGAQLIEYVKNRYGILDKEEQTDEEMIQGDVA